MFGSYGVWSKLIGSDFGVFFQGWSRAFLIALLLFPFLLFTRQIVRIKREDWGWMLVFLIFTSLTQAPIFYAFTHMDIGSATLLFFVSFLLTMYAVGIFFLGERLNTVKAVSFLLALSGLYLVFSFSLAVFALLAALMAVLNGIASGGEVSFSKKLTGQYSALYLSWMGWVAVAVSNAFVSFWLGEAQLIPSFDIVWFYWAAYAVASIIGFWAVLEGLKYVEAGIGGLLGLLEVVFSIAFGILIFSEVLSPKIVAGACLILAAAALPHLYELFDFKRRSTTLAS